MGIQLGFSCFQFSDTESKHVNKESRRKEIERVLHIFGLKSIKSIKNAWKKDSFFRGFYPSLSLSLSYLFSAHTLSIFSSISSSIFLEFPTA